jgi:hypothetical protein
VTITGVWFSQITMPAQDVFIRLFEKPEIRTVGIALQPIFQAVAQVVLNIFDGSKGRSSRKKEVLWIG